MKKPNDSQVAERPPPKELIDEAASAIYQSAVRDARHEVAERKFPLEKITAVFEDAIEHASDREAPIVIFALVDDLTSDFFGKN
jgi:hypothetical protein